MKLGTRFTDGFNPANRPGGNNRNAFQGSPSGGRTPGWTNAGRTPNPYEQGRTPAWNTSSRTPNPYAEGGKTPAWNASSRTPNPYAAGGGRTPAWSADSRTPNPYASGSGSSSTGATWGGATPGRPVPAAGGWGGATPGRNTAWGSSADEGWSPARQGWDSAPTSWVRTFLCCECFSVLMLVCSFRAPPHQQRQLQPLPSTALQHRRRLQRQAPVVAIMTRRLPALGVIMRTVHHRHLLLVGAGERSRSWRSRYVSFASDLFCNRCSWYLWIQPIGVGYSIQL